MIGRKLRAEGCITGDCEEVRKKEMRELANKGWSALSWIKLSEPLEKRFRVVKKVAIPVMVINAHKQRLVSLPFRKHFIILHASTCHITR